MTALEDLLTRELGEVADTVRPPHVDTVGVRRAAVRERRRGRLVVGGVAAAVGLVALAGLLVPRPDGPGPDLADASRELPLGTPLALTWAGRDGTVHLPSGRTAGLEPSLSLVQRGTTTLVGEARAGGPTSWTLVDDARRDLRLVVLTGRPLGTPVISVDGSRVAWAERAAGGAVEVHEMDVASQTTSDVTVDRAPGTAPLLGVGDVDDRGRVLVVRRDSTPLLLRPDGGVVEVADTRDGLTLLPDGRAVRRDVDDGSELVDLADDGSSTPLAALVPWPVTSVAPDAATYLAVTADSTRLEPVTLAPDGTTTRRGPLPLPADRPWVVVGWESATDVVLSDADAPGWSGLVRCSVTTVTCERVPDGPWATVGGY